MEANSVTSNLHKESDTRAKTAMSYMPKNFYAVSYPYGYARIQSNRETGERVYLTIEPTMTEEEKRILVRLKAILKEEANVPLAILKDEKLAEEHLNDRAKQAVKTYRLGIPLGSVGKFLYYVKRDFLGYGTLDIPMKDENVEDISCNGVGIPIYVWHRHYESLPTNLVYASKDELDAFIMRLAYKAGHQISVSRPILEGSLPEGFRVHLTLEEVSKRGDTFTIRKIKTNPFTVIDLIKLGTISPSLGAYFWVLIENLRSIMIAGAAASGKTALLNSIAMFIRPEMKVVTIEEVRELHLHENWIPMTTRPAVQPGVQEVTLFDLLKSSLRQRPDYIVVGEIRGEEAYTLFQSISVGHGGLCTIHAEDVETVEKRLVTRPMNIPPMLIPMMNAVVLIRRTNLRGATVRRVVEVSEIVGVAEETNRAIFQVMYEWNPRSDSFVSRTESVDESLAFRRIAHLKHVPTRALTSEMERRERVLEWMARQNISSHREVSDIVRRYYISPDEIYRKAMLSS